MSHASGDRAPFPSALTRAGRSPGTWRERNQPCAFRGSTDAAGVPPPAICNCDFAWVPQNPSVGFAASRVARVVGRCPSARGARDGLTSCLETRKIEERWKITQSPHINAMQGGLLAPDGETGLPPSLAASRPCVCSGRGCYRIGPSSLHV